MVNDGCTVVEDAAFTGHALEGAAIEDNRTARVDDDVHIEALLRHAVDFAANHKSRTIVDHNGIRCSPLLEKNQIIQNKAALQSQLFAIAELHYAGSRISCRRCDLIVLRSVIRSDFCNTAHIPRIIASDQQLLADYKCAAVLNQRCSARTRRCTNRFFRRISRSAIVAVFAVKRDISLCIRRDFGQDRTRDRRAVVEQRALAGDLAERTCIQDCRAACKLDDGIQTVCAVDRYILTDIQRCPLGDLDRTDLSVAHADGDVVDDDVAVDRQDTARLDDQRIAVIAGEVFIAVLGGDLQRAVHLQLCSRSDVQLVFDDKRTTVGQQFCSSGKRTDRRICRCTVARLTESYPSDIRTRDFRNSRCRSADNKQKRRKTECHGQENFLHNSTPSHVHIALQYDSTCLILYALRAKSKLFAHDVYFCVHESTKSVKNGLFFKCNAVNICSLCCNVRLYLYL